MTDAREDELRRAAEAGASVVLCPRSNLYIEGKLPPLLAVRSAGLAPALGTDSLASNASLDVLAEARALHDRFPRSQRVSSSRWRRGTAHARWGARTSGESRRGRVPGSRPSRGTSATTRAPSFFGR